MNDLSVINRAASKATLLASSILNHGENNTVTRVESLFSIAEMFMYLLLFEEELGGN